MAETKIELKYKIKGKQKLEETLEKANQLVQILKEAESLIDSLAKIKK